MHRDRTERLGERQPRQDLVHGDVQVQPSRVDLLHRDDRRERLRDRADLEARLRTDGGGRRDVGHPADDDPEDLLAVGDGQRGPGGVRRRQVVLESGADAVERLLEPRHAGYSPKKSLSSRAADSGESLPCTRFSVISVARSPRIVPGGRVGGVGGAHQLPPQRDRVVPLHLGQDHGATGDEVDELAVERLVAMLAVVLLGALPRDRLHPQVLDRQPGFLHPAEHFPDQMASDAVRLDDQQRGFDCHGQADPPSARRASATV